MLVPCRPVDGDSPTCGCSTGSAVLELVGSAGVDVALGESLGVVEALELADGDRCGWRGFGDPEWVNSGVTGGWVGGGEVAGGPPGCEPERLMTPIATPIATARTSTITATTGDTAGPGS
jgi:hypothetical protein